MFLNHFIVEIEKKMSPEDVKELLANAGFKDYNSLVNYIAENSASSKDAPKIEIMHPDSANAFIHLITLK